jgi:hypothetical protein
MLGDGRILPAEMAERDAIAQNSRAGSPTDMSSSVGEVNIRQRTAACANELPGAGCGSPADAPAACSSEGGHPADIYQRYVAHGKLLGVLFFFSIPHMCPNK